MSSDQISDAAKAAALKLREERPGDPQFWHLHWNDARIIQEFADQCTTQLKARVEEKLQLERARWQEAIFELLLKTLPDAKIDGQGSESGDPLDFSLAEIRQGLDYATSDRDSLKQQLDEAEMRRAEAEQTANEKCNLLANCADTLRSRGFDAGEPGVRHLQIDERVIAMAKALDEARTRAETAERKLAQYES